MIGSISLPGVAAFAQAVRTPDQSRSPEPAGAGEAVRASGEDSSERAASSSGADSTQALDDSEKQQVQQLQARDREVRAHEAAHLAASGGLARGGASFSFQRGPDGRNYAVGGEVAIDISPGRTPEQTLAKAEQIRAAALAPADPSAQDRRVAAEAARMAAAARLELGKKAAAAYQGGGQAGTGTVVDQFA